MNTFKIKVLLIISNKSLHSAIGKSLLIWFFTNLTGCTILYTLGFFFLQSPEEFMQSLGLSLIFSSPAIVIATGVLYRLPAFNHILKRTTVSLASILGISAIIILIVASVFKLEYLEVARVLYPFTLSAIVCFSFIARKELIPAKNLIN